MHAVMELVVRLRQAGIRAYEGSMRSDGSMVFSFEREAIGQKLTVETVLTAWPGVNSVRYLAPGLVHTCANAPTSRGTTRGWGRRLLRGRRA